MAIDWSATAAWIALAVSITGTIASPLITTHLSNAHQLKMRQLEIEQIAKTKYIDERNILFNSFVAKIGQILTLADIDALKGFGESYFAVYQYVPEHFWPKLDTFYDDIINERYENAKKNYPEIIHTIALIAKEEPQEAQK